MYKKTLLIIICCLSLTAFFASCDPTKMMEIRTADKPNYFVTIYGNHNMLPFEGNNSDRKLVLKCPDEHIPTKKKISFYCGMGSWSGEAITVYAKCFDSIVIVRNGQKQSFTDQVTIIKYLLKQTRGFRKQFLIIEAK